MKMSKSYWIVIVTAFALSVGVTFAIIKLKTPVSKPIGSPLTSLPTPVSSPAAPYEKLYRDEAGFSFKYPSDLTVTDDTPDDNVHYSRLKIKSQDGTMLELVIKDISARLEPVPPAAVDLNFGDMPANQSKINGRLVTAAAANKIFYQMTSPDTDYWQKVHSQIAVSYVEGVVPAEPAGGQTPSFDVIYEPEEIVE